MKRLRNQIFGYQAGAAGSSLAPDLVFTDARRINVPSSPEPWQVQFFASEGANLSFFVSREHETCVYVWGHPAHPDLARADIPAWCAEVIARRQYARFRELLGTFVVVADDPRDRRITFISDVLGVRPLFVGQKSNRIVFGSDVWALHQAGATDGKCNYDAISAWLAYGYNCTDSSLFTDLRRVPSGTALVIQNDFSCEIPYATFDISNRSSTPDGVAEDIHHIVSSVARTLLRDEARVTIALSGGFDSRYLLALCLSTGVPLKQVVNVDFAKEEGEIANRVAQTLGVPLETIPVNASVWDLYADAHHFMADGFPISKFVTDSVAQRHPGTPMVNGFMGDSLVRGSHDKVSGKYQQEWEGDLAEAIQQAYFAISLKFLRPKIAQGIRMRSLVPMQEAARRGASKVFAWADFYFRQRLYISNNFLQHLGTAEAVLPFYSWDLLAYKMQHDDRAFNRDVYQKIFRHNLPALSDIPHASDVPRKKPVIRRSRCLMRWARELARSILKKGRLDLLAKDAYFPLLVLGASPLPTLNRRAAAIVEDAVLTARRLDLLEKRMREANLDLDWSRVQSE